jgi:methyl-accepting chemotaxis protein
MFTNLTIASLLTRMNLFIMAVSLCLGGAFLYTNKTIGDELQEIGHVRLPAVVALHTIDMRFSDMIAVEGRLLLSNDPRARADLAKEAAGLRKDVPGAFEDYKKYYRDDQDRIRAERSAALWAKLGQALDTLHAQEQAGNLIDAHAQFDSQVMAISSELGEALDKAQDDVQDDAKQAADDGARTALTGLTAAILATIIAAASSIAVLLLSRKRVLVPLSQLDAGLGRMAAGDFSVEIPGAGKHDEIGAIARSVEAIKTSAAARAAAEGLAQARVVDALSEGLKAIAAGRMTYRIETAFPPEFDTLRTMFNGAMADLDALIGQVAETAGTVRSASSELSSASHDLATRTETQAARLEATSSAIGNLTQTVRETARSTVDVRSGAEQAEAQASKGAAVASDAMAAMGGIAQSSNQISQITDMIDSIAFQTNLLALNAGVEAARAGDAGKGFAVVANEVRALAQRSTDAARSIKDLIATSSTQVDQGVKLVASSGEALAGIVDTVTELKTLIEGITGATSSQASDLEALSNWVREMEAMTQQNAAMVEEVSGAARNLQSDSDRMAGLVEGFAASQSSAFKMPRAAPPPVRRITPGPARPPMPARTSGNLALKPSAAAAADDWSEF